MTIFVISHFNLDQHFVSGNRSSAMFLYIRQQHIGIALRIGKERESKKLGIINKQVKERKLGQN
jgi:hypothetical protein